MKKCRCGKWSVFEGEELCRLCQSIAAFIAIMLIEYGIELTNDSIETMPISAGEGSYHVIAKNGDGIIVASGTLMIKDPYAPEWQTFFFIFVGVNTTNLLSGDHFYKPLVAYI